MTRTPRRPRTVAVAAALVAAALAAGGCQGPDKGPDASEPIVGPVNAPALARAWKAPLDLSGDRLTQLHAVGEFVFAYTTGSRAYVVDRATGTLNHVVKLPAGRLRPPLVLADAIVYPTAHTLEVYDKGGRRRDSIQLALPPRSGAAASGNVVYIGADAGATGRLLRVDTTRQFSQVRPLYTGGALSAAPATVGGIVYAGSEDGKVYAADEDLAAAWGTDGGTFATGGPITADLAVDNYGLYVASTDSKLYCLNARTGQLRWQFYGGSALRTPPVATDDLVFQHVPGRGLCAVEKAEADPAREGNRVRQAKWTAPAATRYLAGDERYAYLLDGDGRVAAVDRRTGEPRFASRRSDFKFTATNTTKDGVVYAATDKGVVYAIDAVTTPGQVGEVVWSPAAAAAADAVARAD